ncbi:putative sulfate/molybdate transporter [Halomarina rubra]|uniref:Sulfate/molybdate transporter n=1 Tax=Halomarina rubra TaxID=2071873 RepID=A0ABD6AWN5_9EURY|nr:putative sulfate/molybdate transporter [Halomarina rubra]
MATAPGTRLRNHLPFPPGDLTGALGDSVTVLPLVVALAALTPANLGALLLGFAVFQVVWGVRYGLPLSVEPMKALAGLAVAGALSYGEFLAAGMLAGVVLLLAGWTGTLSRVERSVGRPVVRGVQLAVALVLLDSGWSLAVGDPRLALAGLAVAAVVAVVAPRAAALAVLAVGVGLAALATGVPAPALPTLGAPVALTLTPDTLSGAAGQLAMTVGNAAVATSLLCADLFDREVSSDDLATSMGAMSLLAVPFGGLPMCHGSGGLAGKYAFGARTGWANVVLGVLYALAALVAGLLTGFPMALLGVLLGVVALQLGRVALAERSWLALVVGVVGAVVGVGVAFLFGVGLYHLWRRFGEPVTGRTTETTAD